MSITLTIAGVAYTYPSGAADTNWAAQNVAAMQALAAFSAIAPRVLETNVTPVGSPASTAEGDLMTFSLPAGTLGTNGQGIRVTAAGTGVSTADATTVRGYFGSTAVTTKVLTVSQANTWKVQFEVFRTGATSQIASSLAANGGTLNTTAQSNALPSATLSGAVTVKFTGQRAVSSVADSVAQYYMLIEFIPAV